MKMMGCSQTREAVETAARREMVSAEAARHLSGCAPCSQYAKETFALTALMAAQPRVEAPADFDFRLRARLARARDEVQPAGGGWRAFWTRTFSLPQATAALAVIMFAAGAAALYLRPAAEVESPSSVAAVLTPTPAVTPAVRADRTPTVTIDETPMAPISPIRPQAETSGPRAIRTGVGSGRSLRPTPVSTRVPAMAAPDTTLAGAQEVLIYQRGSTRSVVVPRRGQVIWGAQIVGMQRAAATATVETF